MFRALGYGYGFCLQLWIQRSWRVMEGRLRCLNARKELQCFVAVRSDSMVVMVSMIARSCACSGSRDFQAIWP